MGLLARALLLASLTVALDPESALQEAIELKARGESGHLAEAARLLDEVAHGFAAVRAPTRVDALHHLSVMHHEAGENERALALVDEAGAVDGIGTEQLSNLGNTRGVLLRAMRRHAAARAAFADALASNWENKHAHVNLANLLHYNIYDAASASGAELAAEAISSATRHYRAALDIDARRGGRRADQVELLNDFAIALVKDGRVKEAVSAVAEAAAIDPASTQSQSNLAIMLKDAGAPTHECVAAARRALELQPSNGDLHHNLAHMMHHGGELDGAVAHWRRALELKPSLHMTHAALGNHEGYRGNLSGARAHYAAGLDAAVRADAGRGAVDSLRLQLATACIPHIYASVGEIESARAAYGANLDALLDESVNASGVRGRALQLDDPLTSTGSGSLGYYLIYQGHDDRALRQKLATVYWRGAPALRYSAAQSEAPAAPGRRIRVGFLSAFFFRHSVGLLMEGVITGLDRAAFEVFLLPIRPDGNLPEDEVATRLFQGVEHVVDVPAALGSAQRLVGELSLDVLVFGEIGMHTLTYFLAFAHLARRTASFWGHAITSGITRADARAPHDASAGGGIDYFVSSEMFEALGAGAQRKYSERLYLMRGLTTAFTTPLAPRAGMSRADFELPPTGTLYLVPQTLYKLHPDFDELMRRVLLADASGTSFIAMPVAQLEDWSEQVRARWRERIADVEHRILLVRRMAFDEFNALAALADVVLDPFPVGGGRSSFELFSVGAPIVMHYERTSILELTFAMYLTMAGASAIAGPGSTRAAASDREASALLAHFEVRSRAADALRVALPESAVASPTPRRAASRARTTSLSRGRCAWALTRPCGATREPASSRITTGCTRRVPRATSSASGRRSCATRTPRPVRSPPRLRSTRALLWRASSTPRARSAPQSSLGRSRSALEPI